MTLLTRGPITAAAVVGLLVVAVVWEQLPALGAGGLLHPARHVTTLSLPEHCISTDFAGDDVQPQISAQRITVPVLVIHGAADIDTPPAHSERVYRALSGPKRLILVPGTGHNGSLRSEVWTQVEEWIDEVLPEPAPRRNLRSEPRAIPRRETFFGCRSTWSDRHFVRGAGHGRTHAEHAENLFSDELRIAPREIGRDRPSDLASSCRT
jgi:hypothetical protein